MRKRRYRAKNKGQTLARLGILLLIPVLIIGLIVGVVKLFQSGKHSLSMTALPFTASDTYTYTGKGFLYYTGGKLYYKDDSDSKANYELTITSDGADIGVSASSTLSTLYNSSSVLLIGTDYPVEFSGVVRSVACGVSHFAVLRQESDSLDVLQAFDNKANPARQLDFATSSAYLVDFGFDTTDEETLWTLTLDVSGGSPVSTITSYNLNQSVTNGLMTIQDQLVERVCFARSSVFAVTTNYIIRYARVGNSEAYRTLIYGWEVIGVSTSGSQPLFLLRQRGEEGYFSVKLAILPETDSGGPTITMLQLPSGTLSAFLLGNRLAACTADTLYLYDTKGHLLSSTAFERSIESASRLSDTKILLSAGGTLYVATVK